MDLPLTVEETREFARWIKTHCGSTITAALRGLPFDLNTACAIACQETGLYALPLTRTLPVERALARCIFDASGDYPATSRLAFPTSTAAFRARYGDEFTDQLIDEANSTRALRGFGPKPWVYKGYGLFQYDLQYVTTDERFFRQRLWANMEECAQRLALELRQHYETTDDYWRAIESYNGSGPSAARYREQVREFLEICQTT